MPDPPASSVPPPLDGLTPPALPKALLSKPRPHQLIVVLLSLCLGLFLVDAIVSLLDDALILAFNFHLLSGIRGIVFAFALLLAFVVYIFMGFAPIIPKRLFLPVTLWNPVAALLILPVMIYFYGRLQQVSLVLSLCQVLSAFGFLHLAQSGLKIHWPLIAENRLQSKGFSWLNLCGFLLVNVLILLPAVAGYLVLCAALAINHFSDGFVALRPAGFTVQVRKYVRNDGKTVQLVPMAHIAEPEFYQKLSQSFPSNSILLLEGVTDNQNLLTNKITYQRMAKSLGLAEQQKEFEPIHGELVWADVDVQQFTANTIGFLNLVMLIHSKGFNPEDLLALMQYSPPAGFERQLLEDLVHKRNQHVLEEIQAHISDSELIIVPWGAAHMPGIAKGIQKAGFRLDQSREYFAIRFRSAAKKGQSGGP